MINLQLDDFINMELFGFERNIKSLEAAAFHAFIYKGPLSEFLQKRGKASPQYWVQPDILLTIAHFWQGDEDYIEDEINATLSVWATELQIDLRTNKDFVLNLSIELTRHRE